MKYTTHLFQAQKHPAMASTCSIPPRMQIPQHPSTSHPFRDEQSLLSTQKTVISQQKQNTPGNSFRPIPPHSATTQFKKTFKFLKCFFPSLKRNSTETYSQRNTVNKICPASLRRENTRSPRKTIKKTSKGKYSIFTTVKLSEKKKIRNSTRINKKSI